MRASFSRSNSSVSLRACTLEASENRLQVAANVLDLALQLISSLKRLLHGERQLLRAIFRVCMLCLVLVHLFHQALVLVEEASLFASLRIELVLPLLADRGLFLFGALTAQDPGCNSSDDRGNDQQDDKSDGQFGHVQVLSSVR
ncbi:MAG: hypothetical protein P8Y01_15375 [Woeseiaceae bacterium]